MAKRPSKSRRPRRARPRGAARASESAALELGRERARYIIERTPRIDRRRARRGVLVAEGDSWFDYPFRDVLEKLEDRHDWEVESVAHRSDTLEEMVYDDHQLSKLARLIQRLKSRDTVPKAVLLSGGGNDIAGDEFAVLLNHKRSGLDSINAQIVAGLVETRLRTAMVALAAAVTELCRTWFGHELPILIHGYDYPVPDGRGYLGGWWILPGPWLAPGFRLKGYEDLDERIAVMVSLIDRFNTMLSTIPSVGGLSHVKYVNLLGTLSNARDRYRQWWANELHPTERGFDAVAERFARALTALT